MIQVRNYSNGIYEQAISSLLYKFRTCSWRAWRPAGKSVSPIYTLRVTRLTQTNNNINVDHNMIIYSDTTKKAFQRRTPLGFLNGWLLSRCDAWLDKMYKRSIIYIYLFEERLIRNIQRMRWHVKYELHIVICITVPAFVWLWRLVLNAQYKIIRTLIGII